MKGYKDYILSLVINPLTVGIIIGIMGGNLSLGIICAVYSILFWGYSRESIFLVIFTYIVLILSANINFELVFILVFTVFYFIQSSRSKYRFILGGFLLLLVSPLLRISLGYIPVQLLEEINIAGRILLFTGMVFYVVREGSLFTLKDLREQVAIVLTYFLLLLGLYFVDYRVIYLWSAGVIILSFLIPYYSSPERKEITSFSILEITYISIVLGMIAGRYGLLL